MKKIYLLLFIFVFTAVTADDAWFPGKDEAVSWYQKQKNKMVYYRSYSIGGALAASGFAIDPRVGRVTLGLAAAYGLYEVGRGWYEVEKIKRKYRVKKASSHFWLSSYEQSPTILGRWRQDGKQYDDGFYWPTAFDMQKDAKNVRYYLIFDIHAQRIVVDKNGKKTTLRPRDLVSTIKRELAELDRDRHILMEYTTIHRSKTMPNLFMPDASYNRLFWPNYNNASQLYIDIVGMMERLAVLREIVADMATESGGNWPKI